MWCARETTLTFSVVYLSPLMSKVYLLVNFFFQSYTCMLCGLLSFLVGIKRRTVVVSHARETTLTFFIMYLSPLKPISCAGHNSHTVLDNLIIFGRDIYQVK